MNETENDEAASRDGDSSGAEGERDWFLQSVISLANSGAEIGITLTVGGAVISGMLIAGRTYFKELADMIRGVADEEEEANPMLEAIAESWDKLSEIYDKPEGATAEWDPGPFGYIHLRNARVYAPGGGVLPSSPSGVLWRGRLTQISGFAIGQLAEG